MSKFALGFMEKIKRNPDMIGLGRKSKMANDGAASQPSEGKAYQQYVTDGEGKAKWEDRLAYKDTVETVILPETTGVIENDGEYATATIAMDDVREKIKVGDTILVAWMDGKTYECTVFDAGVPTIGDSDSYIEYPFNISVWPDALLVNMNRKTTPDGTEITLSLTKKETIVKPIPAEYLPGYDLVILCETDISPNTEMMEYLSIHSGSVEAVESAIIAGREPKVALRVRLTYGDTEWFNVHTPVAIKNGERLGYVDFDFITKSDSGHIRAMTVSTANYEISAADVAEFVQAT